MHNRVVVAMSGGVDSSVAAALLKEQGQEVIGITMCFNLSIPGRKRPNCCGLEGIEDARRVAHKLGIRHYVLNMQKDLKKSVIDDFCRQYLAGRTPNPCIRCNQYLKFGVLLKKALSLDARYLATGHYARIEIPNTERRTPNTYALKKGKDRNKDQSYFLYRLNQAQLKHTLFPLGDYTKDQVRALAKKFDLPVAEKLASQEICFLPEVNYRDFLLMQGKKRIRPGSVVDKDGNILGRHRGIAFYTIGQRQGLKIAKGYPLYITKIDPRANRITVGKRGDVFQRTFLVRQPYFIQRPIKNKIVAQVRIRYNHTETWADLMPSQSQLKICFKEPQFAITPGQSAVLYAQDTVLGGGIIHKVLS